MTTTFSVLYYHANYNHWYYLLNAHTFSNRKYRQARRLQTINTVYYTLAHSNSTEQGWMNMHDTNQKIINKKTACRTLTGTVERNLFND